MKRLLLGLCGLSLLVITGGTPTVDARRIGSLYQIRLTGDTTTEPDTAWVSNSPFLFQYGGSTASLGIDVEYYNDAVAGDSITAAWGSAMEYGGTILTTETTISTLGGQLVPSAPFVIARPRPWTRIIITDGDVTSAVPTYDLYFWTLANR